MRPQSWKKEAKYMAMHNFARRNFGSPQHCEHCGTREERVYHWAAKNHDKGGRNREDWFRLCVPCHSKFDGRTGRILSEETRQKIGKKNTISLRGNHNARGHVLSPEKRKEISEKTKLGMARKKLLE